MLSRTRTTFCFGLIYLAVFLAPQAAAALAGNLFAAEVSVEDRTAEKKTLAASRALAVVLVKVSGDRNINQQSAAAGLLQRAEEFIQQYRYTPNNTLLVGFDGRLLQQEMRSAGLAVWSADRPATLVWLAIDEGDGERYILSADNHGELRTEIEAVAAERGLALIWPLNDSVDLAVLTAADIWGGYSDKVRQASVRYGADALLVGRIGPGTNGAYYGNWHLQIEGEEQEWRGTVAQSVHKVTDFLAARLAGTAGDQQGARVAMQISGLQDARAYAHALSTLEKLGTVQRVDVLQILDDTVQLQLNLHGDAGQVRRALSFGGVLTPDTRMESSSSSLYYHYGK